MFNHGLAVVLLLNKCHGQAVAEHVYYCLMYILRHAEIPPGIVAKRAAIP